MCLYERVNCTQKIKNIQGWLGTHVTVVTHMADLLQYAHYLTADRNSTVYSYHNFCSQCRCEIKNAYDSPIPPEQVGGPYDLPSDRSYRYVSFCPWCGSRIDPNTLRGRKVMNKRNPDHFREPGWHAGDKHEFAGFEPFDHWLSGGDEICWCKPGVTPKADGCVISHRNVKKHDPAAKKSRKKR